jgi:succinate dehydrogenase / fumarate reductase membrane anchor subunit
MRFATLLFLFALFLHAWVGVRNIFMDYIKDTGVRLILYVLVIVALVAYGVWAVQILWGA